MYTKPRENQGHVIRTWQFAPFLLSECTGPPLSLLSHLVQYSVDCQRLDISTAQFWYYRVEATLTHVLSQRNYERTLT